MNELEKARKEINRIMSIANAEGFYYKPRIDLKCLLSLTPTDTIVTTACVCSYIYLYASTTYHIQPFQKVKQNPVSKHAMKNTGNERYAEILLYRKNATVQVGPRSVCCRNCKGAEQLRTKGGKDLGNTDHGFSCGADGQACARRNAGTHHFICSAAHEDEPDKPPAEIPDRKTGGLSESCP